MALVCDIAEMYLRIGVHPQDRPYQRVLWRSLNQSEKPKILQFTYAMFGINLSLFHAQYVSQHHAKNNKNKYPLAAETILCSTYMDDSMDSVKTCDEAIKLYKELSELWGKAGMHARKWVSNESEVLKEIPEEDRAMEVNLKCAEFPSIKTLGILWKASDDIFTFKDASDASCKEDEHVKQSFLKKIATLFDPLGFLSPYVVQGKVLLQEIWMIGLDWDDPLSLNISKKITNWLKGLETLSSFQVPRCLQCSEEVSEVTFHVFNDASVKAYGSVIYQ